MQLYATVSGEGAPVVLLHGLFGMGSNLGALARALAPHYQVHQLDLPNHGRSEWQANMDLASLASAVSAYLDEHCDTPVSVVGHSLGGKVAMQMALSSPDKLAALVVADIAPVEYPPSHDAVFAAIEAVTAARPASRSEAAKLMREYLQEEGVVQFLVLSLRRDTAGHYVWRFNSECLKNDYARFRAAPEGIPYSGPALFVYGSESSYVDAEGIRAAQALFPRAQFTALADTGHWLHAEKPDEFNALINGFLMTFFSRSDNH